MMNKKNMLCVLLLCSSAIVAREFMPVPRPMKVKAQALSAEDREKLSSIISGRMQGQMLKVAAPSEDAQKLLGSITERVDALGGYTAVNGNALADAFLQSLHKVSADDRQKLSSIISGRMQGLMIKVAAPSEDAQKLLEKVTSQVNGLGGYTSSKGKALAQLFLQALN